MSLINESPGHIIKLDIQTQLLNTLSQINNSLHRGGSDEEQAILLNAKANTLIALQKYE